MQLAVCPQRQRSDPDRHADGKRSCPVAGMSTQRYQRVEPRLPSMSRITVQAGVTPPTPSGSCSWGRPGSTRSGKKAVSTSSPTRTQRHRIGAPPAEPASESRHAARTSATLASSSDRTGFFAAAGQPETALGRRRIQEVSASADVAQLVEHFTRNEGLPGSRRRLGFPGGRVKPRKCRSFGAQSASP